MTKLIMMACGMAVAGGVVALALGVVGTTGPARPSLLAQFRARKAGQPDPLELRMKRQARLMAGITLGLAVWLVTGVFVAGGLVALTVVGLPWLLSPTKSSQARIIQMEALSHWARQVADGLRVGRGLQQALTASRKGAPASLEEPVEALADRLQLGWNPEDALREFADELGDITADKLVAALILSIADRGPGLAQSLEDLAETIREEVGKRRKSEADRAKSRQTVRWMVFITLSLVGLGFLVPSYTAPYGTLLGELVLAAVSAGFIAVLTWMRSLAEYRPIPRFLAPDPRSRVRSTVDPATAVGRETS
ncbi:type II secretion system F family protein [Streptomyces sp. NA02950]|uniref:type II secretion system F family protein n=1 Tax=Streptomyces sp. NA02950 TaxID=2742137 RepID=UPI0015927BC5|nr:type II secretion system F family protein [Streptomyces sp. NA02950]QKV90406.1 type II secretion system F family protein [Streptomyces sp. NA02950]QKV97261.1 type II secretion system F family protein [Streptomyces sp. NA02950]